MAKYLKHTYEQNQKKKEKAMRSQVSIHPVHSARTLPIHGI